MIERWQGDGREMACPARSLARALASVRSRRLVRGWHRAMLTIAMLRMPGAGAPLVRDGVVLAHLKNGTAVEAPQWVVPASQPGMQKSTTADTPVGGGGSYGGGGGGGGMTQRSSGGRGGGARRPPDQ